MASSINPLSLEGKLALVTGSSRGIGRGIALELARQGANIVVNYRLNSEAAAETVAKIEALGRKVIACQADMANPAEIDNLFETISDRFGGLDILVLNAAYARRGKVAETPNNVLHKAMTVNLLGPWLCVKAAVPLMEARGGGRVVAISSPGSDYALPDYAAVGVSKGALNTLVRYLAVELAQYNIVVNAISPGMVETQALRHHASQEMVERLTKRTPLKRTVQPDEVGHLVAFLCSERASMICGQVIAIDGGLFLPLV